MSDGEGLRRDERDIAAWDVFDTTRRKSGTRTSLPAEYLKGAVTEDGTNRSPYVTVVARDTVTGKMVRERPATNFLIGSFFAESLILAETGQSTGAIQIAGTAELAQLPFFVTTCDYTLIGEELYAASAYLSREPLLLGSIKAQDTVKAILMLAMAVGIVTLALGSDIIRKLLETH